MIIVVCTVAIVVVIPCLIVTYHGEKYIYIFNPMLQYIFLYIENSLEQYSYV